MGSHLGAIGFPERFDVAESVGRLITRGHELGRVPDRDVRVLAYDDPSGSRITVTLEGRGIACLTPAFRPTGILRVRVGSLAGGDCQYERPLLVDVFEGEEHLYPLAIQIDDLALSEPRFVPGSMATLEVVGLAETITVVPDEQAFRETGTPMATRSLIPSGMFAIPGSAQEEGFTPAPRMLMTGDVVSADLLTHKVFQRPFVRMSVASFGATYVVLAEESDLRDADGSPVVPRAGSIVSGQFWLSGRLADTT